MEVVSLELKMPRRIPYMGCALHGGQKCPCEILTGRGHTQARGMYSKWWDYGQSTITLEFVRRGPTLFALCRDGKRKRGSTRCTIWWKQPLSIDVATSLPGDEADMGDDY